MSTQIQPGDIVQNATTGSKVIYEVVRIDGDYARVRPLWGASEHTEKVGHLERMCDEQVTGLFQWRANDAYAAMGGVKRLAVQTTPQIFSPGDEVRVLDKRNLSLADTTFLDSRRVHVVQAIKWGSVILYGCPHQFKADRFELVSAGANARQVSIPVAAAAQPVPVPDAKFSVGQVVEWDAPGTTEVVTALVQDAQWAGVAWLYGCEIIGGAKKGLVGRVLEHYLREASGEVEHHKHHHDGHKHVMGLDHDEIDPVAYKEFMRSL